MANPTIINDIKDLEPNPLAIVVSDVHLHDNKEQLTQKILKLFEDVKLVKPKYFLLLGDIFDFCFGGGSYFKHKYDWFYKELIAIRDSGIEVYFVEGNHEFAMEKIGWNEINLLQTTTDNPIIGIDGSSIAVSHGDLFAAPKKYLAFRSLVKSSALHQLCSLLPGKLLEMYANTHSSYSREKSESRKLKQLEILDSAQRMMKHHCPRKDILVFGHFHYPFNHEIDGLRLLSVDSWYKPNALVIYDRDKFDRVYL